MTRRRGLSLTEVLVALFIMALGAIAILTLFPLGALQMGQALKDDRTAQGAGQADGYMRWYWKHYVTDPAANPNAEPFFRAFSNPNDTAYVPATYQQAYPANPIIPLLLTAPGPDPLNPNWTRPDVESGPSYPVVVDPMGWVARGGPSGGGTQDQYWLGRDGVTGAGFGKQARRSLNQMLTPTQALRTCSLLDGITYLPDGTPDLTTGAVQRELRYNWLWVLQLVHTKDPNTAAMTVVVFDKRAHLYVPQPLNHPERLYTTVLNSTSVGSTSVQFNQQLPILKGGWIADVSTTTFTYPDPQPPGPNGQPSQPIPRTIPAVRNCNFYRVVSITDDTPAGGTFKVELQVPIRADSKTLWTPPATFGQFPPVPGLTTTAQSVLPVPDADNPAFGGTRTFMVLTGVSEVFERSNLTQSTAP